jgi:hypothetical protein
MAQGISIPVVNNPNPSETWVRLRKFSCPSIVKVNNATIKTARGHNSHEKREDT